MEEYLRGVLDDFPKKIPETLETPDEAKIFNVRDDNKLDFLGETREQAFHHAVTQLLFTGIRYRKYKQTVISFLTNRVRKPAEDNWTKLRRLLGYQNKRLNCH